MSCSGPARRAKNARLFLEHPMQRALDIDRSRFADWYQAVVRDADMAETSPVRGAMVIKPWGYGVWEQIQQELDRRIKATGHENCYFPMFIPLSFIAKEAEHVEGFAKEMAVVTHHRLKMIDGKLQPDPEAKLEEPLVVRPTSETIIGDAFSRWIKSHRDLPLLLNQWANVVRWELRPRLFLRTTEFLWQEGHTAHASEADARAYARQILHDVYQDVLVNVLAVPVVVGRKTVRERFAGATSTYTLEAMMGDGKALQMGTSHELGQNFARAFGIDYLGASGRRELTWTTSWGITTRLIDGVIETARKLTDGLRDAGVRATLDERVDVPFGRRAIDAELKGYPVRIEVGPRDVAAHRVVVVRRVTREKTPVPVEGAVRLVTSALEADQR